MGMCRGGALPGDRISSSSSSCAEKRLWVETKPFLGCVAKGVFWGHKSGGVGKRARSEMKQRPRNPPSLCAAYPLRPTDNTVRCTLPSSPMKLHIPHPPREVMLSHIVTQKSVPCSGRHTQKLCRFGLRFPCRIEAAPKKWCGLWLRIPCHLGATPNNCVDCGHVFHDLSVPHQKVTPPQFLGEPPENW